jgi:hypothetical protein
MNRDGAIQLLKKQIAEIQANIAKIKTLDTKKLYEIKDFHNKGKVSTYLLSFVSFSKLSARFKILAVLDEDEIDMRYFKSRKKGDDSHYMQVMYEDKGYRAYLRLLKEVKRDDVPLYIGGYTDPEFKEFLTRMEG